MVIYGDPVSAGFRGVPQGSAIRCGDARRGAEACTGARRGADGAPGGSAGGYDVPRGDMMRAVRMSERGTVQLPVELRERLGWRAGQTFDAVARGNVVLLVPTVNANELRGSARGAPTDDYRDDER